MTCMLLNGAGGIRTLHELQIFSTGGSYIWPCSRTKISHSLHRPCTASLPTFQTSSSKSVHMARLGLARSCGKCN